mgnify:CR=1 FL=1
MKDETYEIMKELVKAKDVMDYLNKNYYEYVWMSDIRDCVADRVMDLEDSIIRDIKRDYWR